MIRVVDPILFVKTLVPANYITANAPQFDITQYDNPVSEQLFSEVVGSLAGAFSRYVNDPAKEHRITRIQGDSVGFAQSLSSEVEKSRGYIARAEGVEQNKLTGEKSPLTALEG